MKDHFAVDFICDTLRMMTMNLEDPHQVEDAMEKQLEKHHHEALRARPHALQTMADGLPALGIVAAVLGVIKTMGSITEPPEVLGAMIGGALVGTFLGVFLAYGLVGPMATRLKDVVDEEARLLPDHPVGAGRPPARQRRADLGGDRPRQRARPAPSRASWSWKRRWARSPPKANSPPTLITPVVKSACPAADDGIISC